MNDMNDMNVCVDIERSFIYNIFYYYFYFSVFYTDSEIDRQTDKQTNNINAKQDILQSKKVL